MDRDARYQDNVTKWDIGLWCPRHGVPMVQHCKVSINEHIYVFIYGDNIRIMRLSDISGQGSSRGPSRTVGQHSEVTINTNNEINKNINLFIGEDL